MFVVGTAPTFAVLGWFARRAVTAWQGRLGLLTGVALVTAGAWTAAGGLAAAGVPVPDISTRGGQPVAGVAVVADGRQTVTVTVRPDGFDPSDVAIRTGVPTTLVLHARHASGCVRTVVLADRDGEWVLPADGDVHIDLGVLAAGVVRYSWVMGMYTARLTAR